MTPKKFIGHLKNINKNESGKLEQYIGRIFRKVHDKVPPLIVDFQDNFSVYQVQSRQRMVFYKQHFEDFKTVEMNINIDNEDIKSTIQKVKIKESNNDSACASIEKYCLLD